jgi:hypothetical protein
MIDASTAARLMGPSTGIAEASDAVPQAPRWSVLGKAACPAAPAFLRDVTDPMVFLLSSRADVFRILGRD